jgi:hypothetical protein
MKQTENNEMDLLLRSLARREGAAFALGNRTQEEPSHATHLDADELSSYAERALPAATHARYSIHLADCSRCRKIVAELTSAAGVSLREDFSEPATAVGIWQTIRGLFSHPMLRYAVPTLAFFAIVAVGLVAIRQQRPTGLVARNEPATERVAPTENQQPDTPVASNSAAADKQRRDEYATTAGPGPDEKAKAGYQGQAKPITSGESVSAVSGKDAPAEKAAGALAQPSFAPESAAPPPAKPLGAVAGAQTEPAPRKEQSADRDNVARVSERRQEEERAARDKAEDRKNQVAASQARTAESASGGVAKLRTNEAKRADLDRAQKADDEEAETRSVVGHRFRRQGGVWVDTAYHSSLALTTVARGSEQYRALVADEPPIRTIAEQLQGEVVLVWKGRAYRIR